MKDLDRVRVYEAVFDQFGEAHQTLKTIEELAELQRALVRDFIGEPMAKVNVQEELADVLIMLDQMTYIYDRAEIADWKNSKLERLARLVGVEIEEET